MRIIVQKFGGTSVTTPQVRTLVLKKVQQAQTAGYQPILVVSAMGRSGDNYATDTLIELAHAANKNINARELDQIMYCGEMISAVILAGTLQAAGIDAMMLTGAQVGIITDNNFNNARILKVETSKLYQFLQEGKVPVICGFQGITDDGEFTTLGRGGSDTTASAIGDAINAELVEIYTDVEGIMTADPRIVSNAKILDTISYDEVCQLAHQGAKVIHPRAVELAMQKNIPLVVKSTFSDAPGTKISNSSREEGETAVTDRLVMSVTHLASIAQVTVKLKTDLTSNPNYTVFKIMAESGISVDLININPGQIIFTVKEDLAIKAEEKLRQIGYEVSTVLDCAKVSIVGGGIRGVPGVMASFAEALNTKDIQILQATDSHTTISVLVKTEDIARAVSALHEKFGLSN